jgi:two-component system sensor histidine kinase KdpD
LRTPITIIKTSASNLRRLGDALPQAERQEIAETIETEADQLDRLVGNLLDMSRLRAGVLRLSSGLNSLEEVAGDVAARIWQVTKQERIKIAFPDDMPLVEFDYGLLMQALTNLVDNSLRYEPPASLVEIRGEWRAGEALLKVVNHGETIPDDVKAHLMEPFYHGRDGHIGLGLPIARGIIEAHHGALRVEDTPGGGATFVIMLPHKEEARVEAENPGG